MNSNENTTAYLNINIPLKTQLHTCRLHHRVSIRCISICLEISAILFCIQLLCSSRTFGSTLYHASILASTSLLLNTSAGYQYLSSLCSKRSLWNLLLANS